MTLRFTRAQHTPVFSKESADEIGRVLRYVIDPAARRISAIHVAGRKAGARLADWVDIVGFGPDAVVVANEDGLRGPSEGYEQRVVAGDLDLEHRRVLTDRGHDLGGLVDVEFDERTGRIERLETPDARVAGDGLRMIGPYAVIVRHEAVSAPLPVGEEGS